MSLPLPMDWHMQAQRLYEAGDPLADIAAVFHRAPVTISQMSRLYGWNRLARAAARRKRGRGELRLCAECGVPKACRDFPSGANAKRKCCRSCFRAERIAYK